MEDAARSARDLESTWSSRPFLMKEEMLFDGRRAARGERFGESRAKWTGERSLEDSENGFWKGRI